MERKNNESFKNYRNRIKEAASDLKKYLKGKIIPGTETDYARAKGRFHPHQTDTSLAHVHAARKAKRRKKRKMAHRARMYWLHGPSKKHS
jgi:hypothetical protein